MSAERCTCWDEPGTTECPVCSKLSAPSELSSARCSDAGVESEVCSSCDGYGSISYNPNLNPNAFPATASAKCTHCGGTGRVEQAKPQPNASNSATGDRGASPANADGKA